MELIPLDRQTLRAVYRDHVVPDFPPNERKPLSTMERLMEAGRYQPFGLYEGEGLLGYAFLCGDAAGTCVMLDYLAVCRGGRGTGTGTALLGLVEDHYRAWPCLVAEAEAPGEDASPEENELRRRRLDFYLRAGFRDTGCRVTLFHVRYVLLCTGTLDREAVCRAHWNIYREQADLLKGRLMEITYEKS